jgi:hypothetical protein
MEFIRLHQVSITRAQNADYRPAEIQEEIQRFNTAAVLFEKQLCNVHGISYYSILGEIKANDPWHAIATLARLLMLNGVFFLDRHIQEREQDHGKPSSQRTFDVDNMHKLRS